MYCRAAFREYRVACKRAYGRICLGVLLAAMGVFIAGAGMTFAQMNSVTLIFEEGLNGYQGFEDTSIYSESDNSGGGFTGIFSGTILRNPFDRRALIRVDLTSIPSGTQVESVSLELVVDRSGESFGDVEYTLHSLTKGWGEGNAMNTTLGGAGATAANGDATWNWNRLNVSMWTAAGGDFESVASASALAGQAGAIATWSGAGLVADVQGWIDNPATNNGWIIVSALEGTLGRVKRFFSSESSEAAQSRPRLTVVVSTPPPTSALSCRRR